MKSMTQNAEPISRLLHNTLFSQSGEVFNELQPISNKEFISGILLIAAAASVIGLLFRVFGA